MKQATCHEPYQRKYLQKKNDNKQGSNTNKSYTEILKNSKPQERAKFVDTEGHQKSPNSVASTEKSGISDQ